MPDKTLEDLYNQLETIKAQLAKIVKVLGQGTEA